MPASCAGAFARLAAPRRFSSRPPAPSGRVLASRYASRATWTTARRRLASARPPAAFPRVAASAPQTPRTLPTRRPLRPLRPRRTLRPTSPPPAASAPSSSSSSSSSVATDADPPDEDDWVARDPAFVRALPLRVGAASAFALLLNRLLSGVAPVADAGSAQSRADVLCLAMAGCLVLTGLTWIALTPKPPRAVKLRGADLSSPPWIDPNLSDDAKAELAWVWDAVRTATKCGALAVFHRGRIAMRAGVVPETDAASAVARAVASAENAAAKTRRVASDAGGPEASDAAPEASSTTSAGLIVPGPICERAMASGGGNYLANLALFPGRVEFEAYLPSNAQAVAVTPVGGEGVAVFASGTQRGFTPADQAWFAVVAEKLDVALGGGDGGEAAEGGGG